MTKVSEFSGKVAVITGGSGVLCSAIAENLAREGTFIVLLSRNRERLNRVLDRVRRAGSTGLAIPTNVLIRSDLEHALEETKKNFGGVDFLINCAGGNDPRATTDRGTPFFELPEDAVRFVFDLNFLGTFLACQVFGKIMAEQGEGVILNIASISAIRPLTRIPAYSAAKAAVANFTRWLAVYMAQEYSPQIRVVAIAPGFFLTEQNRYLLLDEKGELTERGKQIIAHTPMKRFGNPEDLWGAVRWLLSSQAAFVTGVIIPVDGGFSAYAGV